MPQRYLLSVLGLIYLFSELVLLFARRSSAAMTSKDANSLRVLWVAIIICLFLSFQASRLWPTALLPAWSVPVGVAIFIGGSILRWYSIIHLGRFFTVNVSIAADHQLVETGPYRLVRHPSYTGVLLAFLGFGMVRRNWLTVMLLILGIGLAFLYRIHVEERVLLEAFGERYRAYMERTKRLIPMLY